MKKYLLYVLPLLAVLSCQKTETDKGDNGGKEDPVPQSCSVSGFAQKGQLAKGSQLTAFATGKDLIATGESFPSNISDDKGAFSISGKTQAPYLELRVDGYYFDELKGALSANPLYLEAFVESSGSKANLNLMTTAIKLRVKNLIKGGKSFTDANKQAQTELLSALGVSGQTGNFYDMDITGTSDSDAVLLAFACMIQNGRDASGVSTFIQEIASDLESDGKLGEDNIKKITDKKNKIDAFKVIENLAAFYKGKSFSNVSIPAFYKHLYPDAGKDFIFFDDIFSGVPTIGISDGGDKWQAIDQNIRILSTIDFTVEKDSDWLEIGKENVLGPAYRVNVKAADNPNDAERVGHVTFKDKNGAVLGVKEFKQDPHVTRLYLDFGGGTKATLTQSLPQVGDKILVNDKEVEVVSTESGYPMVKVAPAEGYSVCWPITDMGYNANPEYIVRTFPSEVIPDVATPFYGGRRNMDGGIMSGDIKVTMRVCTGVLAFTMSNWTNASYVIIKGNNADDCLSGTVTYVWDPSSLMYDPTLVEYLKFENKSREVKVTNLDLTGTNYVLMLPQTLPNGITVTVYDSSDSVISTFTMSDQMRIERGTMYLINIPAHL